MQYCGADTGSLQTRSLAKIPCLQRTALSRAAHGMTLAFPIAFLDMNLGLLVVPAINLGAIPMQHAGMAVDMVVDLFEIFDAVRLP